jgi:hypothetical protein
MSAHLPVAEQIISLAEALVAFARADGPTINLPDALSGYVVKHSKHAPFWAQPTSYLRIVGFIKHEPEVTALCNAQGVLVWVGEEGLTADKQRIRLVNTDWCRSDADKYEHVTRDWRGGRRCRFCGITEPHDSLELQPVGQDRVSHTIVNNVVVLKPGVVHTHGPCAEHWLRYVEVAEEHAKQIAATRGLPASTRKKQGAAA